MIKTVLPAIACVAAVLGFSASAVANPDTHPKPPHCEDKDHHECKPEGGTGH